MTSAHARHILVDTKAEAEDLKRRIDAGEADFAVLAQEHSKCNSKSSGGDLGTFSKGDMVPQFDRVVFSDLPLNTVSEPVQTEFGYHLVEVQQRS